MRIIVQKFGGTSVATPRQRELLADRVAEAVDKGYRTVVVVSAMGRAGDPYATDTLIGLLSGTGGQAPPPRELDLLMSCGETIAAVVVAAVLKGRGLDPIALTGAQAGIITDANFSDARILRVEPERMLRHLKEGRVVVVAGFQGVTDGGDITTLGRGGSDITAAAVGAALKAEAVEIYTDVDGVKTADPRIVSDARTLRVLSYQEVSQMAYEGARVIHPRAVEIAMRRDIPIRILSPASSGPGTLVTHSTDLAAAPWPDVKEGRVITGVTHIPDVAQISVTQKSGASDPRAPLRVFESLAEAGISVDLISVSPGTQVFTVAQDQAEKAAGIIEDLGYEVSVLPDCAKVTIVGARMRGVPGVMAKVSRALTRARIPILQTADSHLTISCLVRQADMEEAIRALHREFGLDGTDGACPDKEVDS
ncbi:MAG TPA: aspartate kinase [Clostridiales bacterium]|nr:aspartate kinase [Clostridiales bacterium]